VKWFNLVGFKVLIGKILFLHDQILEFQNFIGDSHVRSAPSATQILSYAVYWCFVITRRAVWFSTIIYWQVRIFICPFFEERAR